jgi:hypothetical protein
MGRRVGIYLVLAVSVVAGGCTAPRPPLVVTDPDPSVKIPAMKVAVERGDRSVVPQLVADLSSDDPAVRFYAIESLEKLTGQTFGYAYFQDDEARRPAVEKWQDWLKGQSAATRESPR